MDVSEKKYAAILLVIIGIAALVFMAPNIRNGLEKDYYIKNVKVTFAKPYIYEEITFKVNAERFHELFKVYYGNLSDIISVQCSDGLKPYKHGKEIGCKSSRTIKPGEYVLKVKYKPNVDWSYVKWVTFNDLPRKVERVETNGELAYASSLFGEPIVAFYPEANSSDVEDLWITRLVLWSPIFILVAVIPILYYIYIKYGKEYNIPGLPEVYHTLPNPKRNPLEVLFSFVDPISGDKRGGVDTAILNKMKNALNAALVNGVVKGAIKIGDKEIEIIDEKKFNELSDLEKEYINMAIRASKKEKITIKEAKELYKKTEEFAKAKIKNIFSSEGFNVAMAFSTLLFLFGFFGIPLILSLTNSGRLVSEDVAGAVSVFIILLSLAIMIGLGISRAGHLFGRFKNKEVYKEKRLWDAFAKLLSNESLIKKYGIEHKNMWGIWLVYAYVFGIKDSIKKFFMKELNLERRINLTTLRRTNRIYSAAVISTLAPRSRGGFSGAGGLGGGFSGGGGFGAR